MKIIQYSSILFIRVLNWDAAGVAAREDEGGEGGAGDAEEGGGEGGGEGDPAEDVPIPATLSAKFPQVFFRNCGKSLIIAGRQCALQEIERNFLIFWKQEEKRVVRR